MTVGNRIRNLREQRGLTQDELAKRMGYTGKSSISKIESSGNDVTLKKISRVATALNTTPSYLMGWTDDASPPRDTLKDDLDTIYNSLNEEGKEKLADYGNDLLISGRYKKSDLDRMVEGA